MHRGGSPGLSHFGCSDLKALGRGRRARWSISSPTKGYDVCSAFTWTRTLQAFELEGRAPKDSDLVDLRHAITASAAHRIVTEDGALRGMLRRATVPGFRVLSLDEVVALLKFI